MNDLIIVNGVLYQSSSPYLEHYGITGMKKGVRRWTTNEGKLNEAGKIRYKRGPIGELGQGVARIADVLDQSASRTYHEFKGGVTKVANLPGEVANSISTKIRETPSAAREFGKKIVDTIKEKFSDFSKKAEAKFNDFGKKFVSFMDKHVFRMQHYDFYSDYLIVDGTLYLEHHGIKGQRWGVRRYQNADGSLTASGRKRYSESSTKKLGKSITDAGKAALKKINKSGFNVGEKLGLKTKETSEKLKEQHLAKKKEKASQSREGVLKNKKLFSDKELADLEKRFKIEDEMRNAKIRQGAEVAKTIATYANTIGQVASAAGNIGSAISNISNGTKAIMEVNDRTELTKKAKKAGLTLEEFRNKQAHERALEIAKAKGNKKKDSEGAEHSDMLIIDGTLYLSHHGIKGQRWGVRRFQNEDGSLTASGKKRYSESSFTYDDDTGRKQKRYTATSKHGEADKQFVGTTKKQARAEAAANALRTNKDLTKKEIKKYEKDIAKAATEVKKANKYARKVMTQNLLEIRSSMHDENTPGLSRKLMKSQRDADYFNQYNVGDYKKEKSIKRKGFAGEIAGSAAIGVGAGIASAVSGPIGLGIVAGGAAVRLGSSIAKEMAISNYRDNSLKSGRKREDSYSERDKLIEERQKESKKKSLSHHGVKEITWD